MSNRCRACAHSERASIDAALVRGEAQRPIAARYGLSKASIARHARHAATVAPLRREVSEARARSTMEQVRALVADASAALEAAKAAATEPAGVLEAMRELGRLLELQAKLTGELAPKKIQSESSVSVDLGSEWQALRTVILRTLDSHPDARAAVAKAIAEQEAGNAAAVH